MSAPENPPAFPRASVWSPDGRQAVKGDHGMSLRDWFAGQALANSNICTGKAPEWQLRIWFGNRTGLYASEVAAKQAFVFAAAMLAERGRS